MIFRVPGAYFNGHRTPDWYPLDERFELRFCSNSCRVAYKVREGPPARYPVQPLTLHASRLAAKVEEDYPTLQDEQLPVVPDSELDRDLRTSFVVSALGAACFLLLALLPWPYGYYQLLRWVTTLAAGIGAWQASTLGCVPWKWAFIGVAVLFNPIAPISLDRTIWQVIDLATAAFFVVSIRQLAPDRSTPKAPTNFPWWRFPRQSLFPDGPLAPPEG